MDSLQLLSSVDVRVLGSLIEKQITTPDNYPLTVNALVAACNQTTNRDPVMTVTESDVLQSLRSLEQQSLAREVFKSDSRAKRYRHHMTETLHLHLAETAALCVLMLRGPQTTGEIRTRTSRMFEFIDLRHVELTLDALMTLTPPLALQLPRRPGQKEVRYAHLLSGPPELDLREDAGEPVDTQKREERPDRIRELEATVEELRGQMAELRAQFDEFRRQFQ